MEVFRGSGPDLGIPSGARANDTNTENDDSNGVSNVDIAGIHANTNADASTDVDIDADTKTNAAVTSDSLSRSSQTRPAHARVLGRLHYIMLYYIGHPTDEMTHT